MILMKRLLLNILLVVLTVPAMAQFRSLPGLDDSETVRSFREHVTTLSSAALEGRKAGSEGEKSAASYVDEVPCSLPGTATCSDWPGPTAIR